MHRSEEDVAHKPPSPICVSAMSEMGDGTSPPLVAITSSPPADTSSEVQGVSRPSRGFLSISEVIAPNHNSLVGGLTSAVVHMVILIVGGLLFATVQQDGALELQMAVANTNAAESIETLTFDAKLASERDAVEVMDVTESHIELKIDEPTLISEFGDVAASDDVFDAMASLSEAVRPPGGEKSGEQSDEKGSFFGADAYGDEFVYVVDMSTSMGYRSQYGQTRFRVACRELLRSIKDLTPNQTFCVFMFCYRTRVMFDTQPRMIRATPANKERVAMWINGLRLGGGTDPRYGTAMALKLKPDAIFLLSDGEFNGRDVNTHGIRGNPPIERLIERQRKDTVPIHTIAFEDMLNRKRLRRIATATAGTHRFVGNVSDQQLVIDDLRSKHPGDVAFGLQTLIEGTQKIRDDRHLKRATKLIADQLASRDRMLRELAHDAMRILANGADLGPTTDAASHKEYVEAKKKWLRYWADHFQSKRASSTDDLDQPRKSTDA